MSKTNEVVQPTQGYLDHPVFVPAKIVLTPLTWTLSKVSHIFSLFLGTCVRIGVFSFGEWQRSWFRNKIIEVYSGGISALFGNTRWSDERLERSFQVLINIGGQRKPLMTKDGMKLDSMLIRYQDVKATIEKNGGIIRKSVPVNFSESGYKIGRSGATDYVDMIIPKGDNPAWDHFTHDTLQHFKLEKASIVLENGKTVQGFITNHWDEKNAKRPKEGQCFVRCNSPTESFPMSKADIMRRVFLGQDVLCFDYRGTWKSDEGIPSEGGYYLDAEAAFEKAQKLYQPNEIILDGFCEGAAVSTYLYTKYHHLGVNLFMQNPFDTMSNVLKQQASVAAYGIDGIKSGDETIEAHVEEDGFDNLRKFGTLEGCEKKGCVIVVSTDTDRLVGPDAHKHVVAAAEKVAAQTFEVVYSPADRESDGHRIDVLSDRPTWRKVVAYLAAKEPQARRSWS